MHLLLAGWSRTSPSELHQNTFIPPPLTNASSFLILWMELWINTNHHSLEYMLRREITCQSTHAFPSLIDSVHHFSTGSTPIHAQKHRRAVSTQTLDTAICQIFPFHPFFWRDVVSYCGFNVQCSQMNLNICIDHFKVFVKFYQTFDIQRKFSQVAC